MRKIFFLIGFLANLGFFAFGQRDISGIYTSESGEQIILDNNTFTYVIPQDRIIVYYNDTLAQCTYRRISRQFIEVNTINDNLSILRTIKIRQHKTKKSNNGTLVRFIIPYDREKLEIEVFEDFGGEKHKLEYSQDNQEVQFSKNISKLTFYIRPKTFPDLNSESKYYGRISYDPLITFEIDDNVNEVEVEIPIMGNSFFDQYHLIGEYVRIKGSKIIWQREIYRKYWRDNR